MANFDYTAHREGSTTLYVPRASLEGGRSPVFFNRKGSLTRDVSVLFARRTRARKFLDAMCGVGARGLRVAKEARAERVVLNDINPDAIALAQLSARENGLDGVELQSTGANALLALGDYREGFDTVDLDPYGTPAPFVSNAVLSTRPGGVLAVCATDGANLCGNRPKALERLYAAFNRDRMSKKETALRILAGFVVRTAAIHGAAAKPVLCYNYGDYFRCHFSLERSSSASTELLQRVGYFVGCEHTHYSVSPCCRECHAEARAGPLWTGELCEVALVGDLLRDAVQIPLGSADTPRLLEELASECVVNFQYVDLPVLLKNSRTPVPKKSALISGLRRMGYLATSTHFSHTAIRTNAPQVTVTRLCNDLTK